MLRPRAQMALEYVDSFQYLKILEKIKSGPERNLRALKIQHQGHK